jgi:hypothetical protein
MNYTPWIGNLTVSTMAGNYGTVKLFLDESAPSELTISVTVEIAAQGMPADMFEVDVFTNLNRRDFARAFEPLTESENQESSYWLSFRMTLITESFDNFVYRAQLPVTKCGAYRLTTRYRPAGSEKWWWHNEFAPHSGQALQRDCAILVSPTKARRLRVYEANALTVEAVQGGDYQSRSTLDDFLSSRDFDGFNPFHLNYICKTLGFNVLWLMPVFPITRWRWDSTTWNWASNDNPGSPYSTRDYWSINPWLANDGTSERAMQLFLELIYTAEAQGLDVFIDTAFNHAGRDVIFGSGAVKLGLCTPQEADSWIREVHPMWCTRGNEFNNGHAITHYREKSQNGFSCALWGPADRLNEHVWDDANVDWFFGDYSSLGPKACNAHDYHGHPVQFVDERGGAEDERDLFYTDLSVDSEVHSLWRYFALILPYWLERTSGKLAGMRADFAQGLPNQLWEFIVNTCRQKRWDFIFLAEVLDPDPVQYRLNKVFDVLTTKDHYLYRESQLKTSQIIRSLESEARIFSTDALIMHNGTSHDEHGNPDKWAMVARYAISACVYGMPMVFMGQPLGLDDKLPFRESWSDMYMAWTKPDMDRTPVAEMYRRINAARDGFPELMSTQRYFLNLKDGGLQETVFAVARWVDAGSFDSVVLVFVNLSTANTGNATFGVPKTIRLCGHYMARNLMADNPAAPVWADPITATDIYENGIYVSFSYPNEVQYIQLEMLAIS